MAHGQCTDLQACPTECLEVTSLTLDALQPLVSPFEAAFHAHLAVWRLDGQPRPACRFTVYKHCLLPPPRRSPVLPAHCPQNLCASRGPRMFR